MKNLYYLAAIIFIFMYGTVIIIAEMNPDYDINSPGETILENVIDMENLLLLDFYNPISQEFPDDFDDLRFREPQVDVK